MLGTYLRAAMAVSESLKRAKSVTYSTVFFSTLQRAYRVSTCVLCINRDPPPSPLLGALFACTAYI